MWRKIVKLIGMEKLTWRRRRRRRRIHSVFHKQWKKNLIKHTKLSFIVRLFLLFVLFYKSICYLLLIVVLLHIIEWKWNEYKSDYNNIIEDFAYKVKRNNLNNIIILLIYFRLNYIFNPLNILCIVTLSTYQNSYELSIYLVHNVSLISYFQLSAKTNQ
jgi:hypothetical protein